MALSPVLLLALGIAANSDTACPRATPQLSLQVRVFVGQHQGSPDYSHTVEELRRVFRCYPRAFTVVADPWDADLTVLVLSRAHFPRNATSQYQLGVSVLGTRVLPGNIVTGSESWEDCYHDLATGLVELISGRSKPHGMNDNAA